MFPILLGKTKKLEDKCKDLQIQIDEGGGSGDSVFYYLSVSNEGALDKTWKEIKDLLDDGKIGVTSSRGYIYYMAYVTSEEGELSGYYIKFFVFPDSSSDMITFSADSPNSYPVLSTEE